jgi:hypothetical protein
MALLASTMVRQWMSWYYFKKKKEKKRSVSLMRIPKLTTQFYTMESSLRRNIYCHQIQILINIIVQLA